MVNPLDVVLRRDVAPVLEDAGFVKAGRTYRLAAGDGDYLVVSVQTWGSSPGVVGFFVEVGIVASTKVEWLCRNDRGVRRGLPGVEHSVFRFRVEPPPGLWRAAEGPGLEVWWSFREDTGGEECGRALAGVLRDEVVPVVRPLLDRRRLLDVVRDPSVLPFHVFGLMSPRERSEIVLLVDDGPSRELEEALRVVEAQDPRDMVAVWARKRVAERAQAGG